ncbi:MAG: ubiquitin-like small modifier protein 1 [Euryarchaeota archaeon]|nr:MAG: Small archaeal modifier protein 3 [ANME-2 cluster archaeon]MEA1865413.1 ubiquitin-like small modifier protein 1 [Euryarchaeota archaeon]
MIIKLKAFAIFGEVLGNERSVELGGKATVSDLLTELCIPPGDDAYDLIFDGSGMIKKHVHILVNGRHIQSLIGIKTELVDGDEVAIFPPVAGG